jgi:hypothetical protein
LNIQKNVTGNLAYIKDKGSVLVAATAPCFATAFFTATINLLSTNLRRILDWVSRLTADSLKVSFLSESQFWSESKIYPTVVWTMITIAPSGDRFVMALYSTMLIVLDRWTLPDPARAQWLRIITIMALFLIALSLFLLK